MGRQAESTLQENIQKEIKRRGGYVIKKHQSMIDAPGIPDLLVCYRGLFLGIEVKIGNNRPSAQQGIHLRAIKNAQGYTLVTWDCITVSKFLDIIDTNMDQYTSAFEGRHFIRGDLRWANENEPREVFDDGSKY